MHSCFATSLGRNRWVVGVLLLWLVALTLPLAADEPLPGEVKDWQGFASYAFEVDGRSCRVVAPTHPAPGKPWVWRARFPDFHAQADRILLERGFHVAYMNTNGMFGADHALDHWDRFYTKLTQEHGLAKRVALEGVSRGGLFIYRWAARHPERVACIYADTPVCDFKSWPMGLGKSRGDPEARQALLRQYHLTYEQALAWDKNPIDPAVLKPLAQAGVPLMHIVSLNDKIVPPAENTSILAERYRELGGSIDIIEVPEGTEQSDGHHFPHPDPVRVADFIERHASVTPDPADYFTLRGSLDNCRIKFEREKTGKVVFMGGSITVMKNGWRQMTRAYLQQRFPETRFTFVNAGVSSTGSPFAAFRLMRDAFSGGPPDLLFEEAAVNDLHVGQNDVTIKRGMEGVIRQVRETAPMTDVVLMHFAEPRHSADYRAGRMPAVIQMHEAIAERYAVPSIHLAREVPERIDAGQFSWEKDFKNLHPAPFGHRLYASTIRRTLSAAWDQPLSDNAKQAEHRIPQPIDPFSYSAGKLVAPSAVTQLQGFTTIKRCDPRDNGVGGRVRPGFYDVEMLVGDEPGDSFQYAFTGRGIGLVVVAGPDAGEIAYQIDDQPWRTLDLKTRHKGIHLPRLHMLADQLTPDTQHTLTVKLIAEPDPAACRLVYLAVNGE